MSSLTVEQIHLTVEERAFLRSLEKCGSLPLPNSLHNLVELKLVEYDVLPGLDSLNQVRYADTVHLSDRYFRYAIYRRDVFFQAKLPVVLSIAAILLSMLTLILEVTGLI